MENIGFIARFEAKAGKEKKVEQFLINASKWAKEEKEMIVWYAFRTGPSTFGIFDTFQNEEDSLAHLSSKIVQRLKAEAGEVLTGMPVIEKLQILTYKEKL